MGDALAQNDENNIKDKIIVINYDNFNDQLKQQLDTSLQLIQQGQDYKDFDLNYCKTKLKDFLKDAETNGKSTKYATIAELLTHLYLLTKHNAQLHFVFDNLEDNSFKKGFDGLYTINSQYWFMESKSGKDTTTNITHSSKIKEAYNDIKEKIEEPVNRKDGDIKNDPWKNALNHSYHALHTDENLKKRLKTLSNDFTVNRAGAHIEDFNIIPSSTIFFKTHTCQDSTTIKVKVSHEALKFNCKQYFILCFNNYVLDDFYKYLEC